MMRLFNNKKNQQQNYWAQWNIEQFMHSTKAEEEGLSDSDAGW